MQLTFFELSVTIDENSAGGTTLPTILTLKGLYGPLYTTKGKKSKGHKVEKIQNAPSPLFK